MALSHAFLISIVYFNSSLLLLYPMDFTASAIKTICLCFGHSKVSAAVLIGKLYYYKQSFQIQKRQ